MASDEFGFRIPQGDLRDLCVSATFAMPVPPYTIEANPSCGWHRLGIRFLDIYSPRLIEYE